jgi:hypothetical protein
MEENVKTADLRWINVKLNIIDDTIISRQLIN